jgi:hypothetical protein
LSQRSKRQGLLVLQKGNMKKKLKKYIFYIFQAIIAAFLLFSFPSSHLFAQKKDDILPNIRRVLIEKITSNTTEFKNFALQNEIELEGILTSPTTSENLDKNLTELLLLEGNKTGRFWLSSTKLNQTENQAENLKKLDLDAILKTQIQFNPEHTAVKFSLYNAKSNFLLVKEDILGPAQLSQEKIVSLFEQGFSRLIKTLGHDGKITSLRGKTAVLNFGQESGLSAGDIVDAGVVVLSELHPQTKEYLKVENKTFYRFKVLESSRGSALCEMVQKNDILQSQIFQKYSPEEINQHLLAWKPFSDDFLNPPPPKTKQFSEAPFSDQTPLSFSKRPVNKKNALGEMKPEPTIATEPENSPFISSIPNKDLSAEKDLSKEQKNNNETNSNEPFKLERFSLGIGATYAILETKRGDRFTDSPPLLFNSGFAFLKSIILNEYKSFGELTFRDYSGGDVTGGETTFFASAYFLNLSQNTHNDSLLLGAMLGAHFGNVKSRFSKKDLFYASLYGTLMSEIKLSNMGLIEIQAALAPFDLLAGDLAGRIKIDGWFYPNLPKQLGFYGIARKGPIQWSAFEFGLHWNLL